MGPVTFLGSLVVLLAARGNRTDGLTNVGRFIVTRALKLVNTWFLSRFVMGSVRGTEEDLKFGTGSSY